MKLDIEEQYIKEKFKDFLKALKCFHGNASLQEETAKRVTKMYCREIFSGQRTELPKFKLEPAVYKDIVVQKNIKVNTVCQHHFLPVLCNVTIAYDPTAGLIGLSKLNRIAKWCGSRPCLQEQLTNNIHREVERQTGSKSVAVFISGVHLCVKMRGIKDNDSEMKTRQMSGMFNYSNNPNEYQKLIDLINYR